MEPVSNSLSSKNLPYALYRAEQVREFDRIAIEEFGIPGVELMQRAGQQAFVLANLLWPKLQHITIVCGAGNNAGDGYVIARLAKLAGLQCDLYCLQPPGILQGDAKTKADEWIECGGICQLFQTLPQKTDLIVDALLGTGLTREVSGDFAKVIKQINQHQAPVLAIDIPSGLDSDTGSIRGIAIKADVTISFIGLKQGLFTADGPEMCGSIHFDSVQIPAKIYARQILSARRLDYSKINRFITPRARNTHKGSFGKLLIIGGNQGYSGAARLAGEAALRSGAGLVAIASHPAHASILNIGRPELMCHSVGTAEQLQPLLDWSDALVLGPGLGQNKWGEQLFKAACDSNLPMVVDADGLNLLAKQPQTRNNWILTPHPGEAARMLGSDIATLQQDRFKTLNELTARFGGVVILKGVGSLIGDNFAKRPGLCSAGNPGLATAGSGDVLSGLIGALMAQGLNHYDAAETAVCVHATAADKIAAESGERGLLASDLLPVIRELLNPEY